MEIRANRKCPDCQVQQPSICINDSDVACRLNKVLPTCLADIIYVVGELYNLDRLTPFEPATCGSIKKRTVHPSLGVRQLDDWKKSETQKKLIEILEYMTDDHWRISLDCSKRGLRVSESQGHLFGHKNQLNSKVMLLSGGLDSLAGIAAELQEHPTDNVYLISVVTNDRLRACQEKLAKLIRQWIGGNVTHIKFDYRMVGGAKVHQYGLRRTCGLLFLSAGLVTASQVKSSELLVFENGIGAINLPYERANLCRSNSKAVHPTTLRLVTELYSLITGQQVTVRNPCEFKTKAEMCRALPKTLRQSICKTHSCDTFASRRVSTPRCGTCTSCILRQIALYNAGLDGCEPSSSYHQDARSLPDSAARRHTQGLAAMDWQVARLRQALAQPEPWTALVREFPDLSIVEEEWCRNRGDLAAKKRLVNLYRKHTQEFRSFMMRRGSESR